MPNKIRVLGVDPGFGRCGVAILEKDGGREKLLYSTCLITPPKETQERRLLQIAESLQQIIKKWKPKALALEKLFFNINARTALKVAEARGVILVEAAKAHMSAHEYSPQDVKVAVTGYGKASKGQVEAMTMKLLSLNLKPKYDDETDAIAVGITHLASMSRPWYK